MIDKYIILNRKPNLIIRLFIYNALFLTGLIIWCINTFTYQKYFLFHSQILNLNSYYFLEVLIPVKEVNEIKSQDVLWINTKKYKYQFIKMNNSITYKNKINYIKVYLRIENLEKDYQKNGYHIDIKIKKIKNKED